jgi:hypothetical protein
LRRRTAGIGKDEGHEENDASSYAVCVVLRRRRLPGFVEPMAWEKRKRGEWYYTRSRRVDGKVVREYVGGGLLGELAACRDAEQRRCREEEAARARVAVEHLEDLAAPLGELWEAVEVLARAHLIAAGYHRHKREWRLRRGHG